MNKIEGIIRTFPDMTPNKFNNIVKMFNAYFKILPFDSELNMEI